MDAVKRLCEAIEAYVKEMKGDNKKDKLILQLYDQNVEHVKYENIEAHVLAKQLQTIVTGTNGEINMFEVAHILLSKYVINKEPMEKEKDVVCLASICYILEILEISIKDALEIITLYTQFVYIPFLESKSSYYTNLALTIEMEALARRNENISFDEQIKMLKLLSNKNGYEMLEKYEINDPSLTEEDRKMISKMKEVAAQNGINAEAYTVCYCNSSLKNRLVNKREHDEFDIKIIVDCLLKLDCDKNFVMKIQAMLEKN